MLPRSEDSRRMPHEGYNPVVTSDFEIDSWVVRPQLHLIERGDERRRLSPKAMAVLECLAERPGTVVGKEELVAAAWTDAAPSDEALATVVYELRQAFDDEARSPRVIETIRKRGFRIVAPIRDAPAGRIDRFGRPFRLALFASALAALIVVVVLVARAPRPAPAETSAAPTIQSLAVLPFTTLTSYDEDLLAAALGEMLIADLDQVCSAEISPAIAVRERERWLLDEAARDLGADAVVEGSVLRSGSRVWISIQLVETSSGRLIWSAGFERDLGDELVVLREVALEIAREIQARVSLPADHEPR